MADRRIIDDAGNVAEITTTHRLKVEATVASTADLDTINTTLAVIGVLLQGTGQIKMMGIEGANQRQVKVNASGELVVALS
jgi:hypothetical protein